MNKLTNFENTLAELKNYLALPIQNSRDIAGIIQAFEFTFEQSWKAIQKIATIQGVDLGNPKAAFTYALQNGWILSSDEPKWLQLLKDRNLTTHTYQETLAQEVLQRIQSDYLQMFEGLFKQLSDAQSAFFHLESFLYSVIFLILS